MTIGTRTIKSDGALSHRGYAMVEARRASPEPTMAHERIVLVNPTQTATRTGLRAGAGPRNPEQMAWPPPKGPAIVLPDGRPLTKAQRFWIDPDLFTRWDAEEAARAKP
jgi:hypothetical protein